ncbi:MAG: four helix bundle protein [Thermodesulfovibrionales bacterium]
MRTKESYKVWHKHLINVSKIDRHTIGIKIDGIFLSLLETIFRATFACDKFEKLSLVSQAIGKNDLLKFFLQIGWEQKVLDHAIYGNIIIQLDEIGRMLGGWKKSLQDKTPTNK